MMDAALLPLRDDRAKGFGLALAFHGLLLAGGTLGLSEGARYGMSAGGGAEVDLVAAPAPLEAAAPSRSESLVPAPAEPDPDLVPAPEAASPALAPAAAPAPANALLRAAGGTGDGSSTVAGQDATTRAGAGGADALKLPGYDRNPPPAYPAAARRAKQEGRVLLAVVVSAQGRALSVALKQSSGFPLLDEAALAGVKSWRFKPARLAGIAVETAVDVPIRFQLK